MQSNNMAVDNLVLCNPLCFLMSKYGKSGSNVLKSTLADFYAEEDLITAKQQVMRVIERINTTVKKPRMATRRDGSGRIAQEVNDLLELMTFLDENQLTKDLPL